MLKFELLSRNLVVRHLDDDPDSGWMTEKEWLTNALDRYIFMRLSGRDMYRETLDDIADRFQQKKPIPLSFLKRRRLLPEPLPYYRKAQHHTRRLFWKRRLVILRELESYGLLELPRWPWQNIPFFKPIAPLRNLIADFEHHCSYEKQQHIVSRIEYDEIRHQLLEYVGRADPVPLRDFKNGSLPERFMLCLFKNRGKILTHKQIYRKMGIADEEKGKNEKTDKRIARWKSEKHLDTPDVSGKYFFWLEGKRLKFDPVYRAPESRKPS